MKVQPSRLKELENDFAVRLKELEEKIYKEAGEDQLEFTKAAGVIP